jgi:uncharacterized membrane protein YidH (DUF202 family)
MDKSEKIEKMLNSLDNIGRAKANPFLFEKIKAGLNNKSKEKTSNARLNFAVSLAMIAAIIINISVWTSYSAAIKYQTNTKENITSFTEEYFNFNTTYNY